MEEEFYDKASNNESSFNNNLKSVDDLNALQNILQILRPFDKKSVKKILKTILTFYDLENIPTLTTENPRIKIESENTTFSENRDITPKEFMMEKNPQTDVERVACLAYYLTHYREQEEFKTIDLNRLNIEAAQIKFANTTVSVDHATRHAHFLVSTKKGFKKISAIGELYVQALPNREEAKEVANKNRPKRKTKLKKTQKNRRQP